MIKPRLFLKVLGFFGLLVIMISVITFIIINVFNQVEGNFSQASKDISFLDKLEQLRHFFSDIPAAADEYMITKSPAVLKTYNDGDPKFELIYQALLKEEQDSITVRSLQTIHQLYFSWRAEVGNKKIALASAGSNQTHNTDLLALTRIEAERNYLPDARKLIRELYQWRMSSQPRRIQIATNLLKSLTQLVGVINVALAFFAIVIGFVLTRSITKPVQLLIEGTQKITAGKFETIRLTRGDELGQLALDFNKMSNILQNNYTRLKAYSELVTALNTYTEEETVEVKSLELISQYSNASVGGLFVLNNEKNVFELVAGYGLQQQGKQVKQYAWGEGIPGQCAVEKKILEINDIPSASVFAIDTGFVTMVPRYIIAVPIIFQNEVLGVVVLGSMSPFDELKKEILTSSVPQIGIAITNVRNLEATQRLSKEITMKNLELNSKNTELEKAYKVKSDFLSSMSHELRTPLNSIIGFTSILLGPQGDPLTPDQKMALEKVLRNGKHLLQLINDILDFSKIEAGRMPINIESDEVENVVANAAATVEALIKSKNLELVQQIPHDLPKLNTDVLKIKQILVNLLSNAAKFTDHGKITIRVAPENGMLQFAVSDTGIGIEKKNLELVFQEFQQIDGSSTRKYQGTGLGLPISRRLARMLGGDLTVESEYGKGSTFVLTVPPEFPEELKTAQEVVTAPTKVESRPAAKTETATPAKNQILCIDDDPDVLEILRKYLVPEGYSVVTALSGDEGIQKAAQLRPALITLDIMMPHKDGWQVLRELKQNPETRDIPVIIHSMIDNKPLAISLGAKDVLPKPVDKSQLLNTLRKMSLSSKQSILIVDDSEDFCYTMKRMLEDDGFSVRVAYNGKEALQAMKTETPALILLDLLMPVMDGFQFLRSVQDSGQWRDVPIVILSAKELTQQEVLDLNKRITEYLHKRDFSREVLSKTVNRILGKN